MSDENFPRGGKKKIAIKRKHEAALFVSLEKHSMKKKACNFQTETEPWQPKLNPCGTLTYNIIQDGMIILACIRHISNFALEIELPGLTFGSVGLNRVSDVFTNILTKKLQENDDEYSLKNLFTVGDVVVAKILTVHNTEKGHVIQATLNPRDINADKFHNSFKKGVTLWATIVSELDHGYELSLGVNNCRVFLPFKNVDQGKIYAPGETLFCNVNKVDSTSNATILTVTAKKDHIEKIQTMEKIFLHDIIPGYRVKFLVEEVLPHGFKGSYLENYLGYLDESQTFSMINKEKITVGSILRAYVLFIEPVTKLTYLTLRNLQCLPSPEFKVGNIMSAEVLSTVPKGLYLKLNEDTIGFVTNKRLLNNLPNKADINIISAVQKKYSIGSRHYCRILDYNHLQQTYICTLEKNIIKEEVFSVKDLKLGQKVAVKVVKIIPNGLVVKTGNLQGFVPNLHLSCVKYSHNIKKKFSEGMIINARVLSINAENNVIFTLKQGLVESDKCLTNRKDVIPNTEYIGFIIQTKFSGALVAFYGNIKGWISNKVLNSGNTERYMDPRDFFFVGQVVSVWITGFKDDEIQLSLNHPSKKKKIKLGEKTNGIVTKLNHDCVEVEVGHNKVQAVVPVTHLTNHLLLSEVLLKTFKIGDQMENLLCIKSADVPIMSRREALFYQKTRAHILRFKELKKDMILRCFFEQYSPSGIVVSTLVRDYDKNIDIPNENIIFSNDKNLPKFVKDQCLLTKILNVHYGSKSLTLEVGVYEDINNALNLLTSYIEDIDQIINYSKNNDWKITQYKIGQRVKCKVKNVDNEGNCIVTLPNDFIGVISSSLSCSNIQVNSIVEGVVLDYNFIDNYIYICCRNDIKQRINSDQDVVMKKPLKSFCLAEVLLLTKFYALGILKDRQCKKQLVYLPLFFNENNNSLKEIYEQNSKLKIYLERKIGNKVLGVPKKLVSTSHGSMTTYSKHNSYKIKINEINKDTDTECKDMICDVFDEQDLHSPRQVLEENSIVANQSTLLGEPEYNLKNSRLTSHHKNSETNEAVILSGLNFFYSTEDCSIKEEEDSSSDDEEKEKKMLNKNKKLSPQERLDLAKVEEERITNIEKELADSSAVPESAEYFDRLLLANPNSSELWLKYMAMHAAGAEVEKARTVGKRALETINMTLTKEKMNVWIALLKLENMYGTKESFEKLFEDAVRTNNSLDIYLAVIKILAASGKLNEMEEKIKKAKLKEKQNSKMWLEIAKVYYLLNKYREARGIKEAALKSISDKKKQFDLIVKFGIMEFQMGELEQAIANFETIIETYPAKINILIIYIDQLVKKNRIDCARNLLERAVQQKFHLKNMRTIFQKFISFEEQYGSPLSVEEVKRKAKQYVKSI